MSRWKVARERQIKYAARCPTEIGLYRLVFNYRQDFERYWEDLFEHEYGALKKEVLKAFDKYLDCGILLHGAARAKCPKCKHSILVAYSCKRRCLCPSCDAKRSLVFAENLFPGELLHQWQKFRLQLESSPLEFPARLGVGGIYFSISKISTVSVSRKSFNYPIGQK